MAMTADQLPDDPDALKAVVLARDVENARLIQIIRELQRHRFGRRAETLPEDQLLLGLEEAERADPRERIERAAKRRANLGALPAHLPLPLYRQAQIYARQGINLDRSTLADWVGRASWHLRPIHARLLAKLKASPKLFADETTAPVLDPGRGKTKTGPLWAYARDDRPWQGADPPGVAYVDAPDRKAERPIAHLAGFTGILQVDGYGGYRVLADKSGVTLVFCWAHVRRRFYELAAASPAPITSEALRRIAELYRVEDDIRGRSAEQRRAVRQEKSRPIVADLEPWLREKLGLISQKTKLAEAIRYTLSRLDGLSRFLDDGRIEIDRNIVERSIRPIALNRKNALFAGSDGGPEHRAAVASLIETCKLNSVEPLGYLADVLTRIVNAHPNSQIDELLPWPTSRLPNSEPWPENSAYRLTP
ncbi:IS66 family transposase [Aminobacter sp. MSH1]|uniref:IS66 family transposase n=1 Tax=Aminobacter sp. MSH1 TaxID=374606 RepID=UPI000D3557E1|nr:IS66 family transposase [Aminobacter sp. MSH1]